MRPTAEGGSLVVGSQAAVAAQRFVDGLKVPEAKRKVVIDGGQSLD